MKLNVYSVFDDKAKVYSKPFNMAHNGEALRLFADAVSDVKSSLNRHPSDYHLYRLAEFDDVSGVFKSLPNGPEFLAHAIDFVAEAPKAKEV